MDFPPQIFNASIYQKKGASEGCDFDQIAYWNVNFNTNNH